MMKVFGKHDYKFLWVNREVYQDPKLVEMMVKSHFYRVLSDSYLSRMRFSEPLPYDDLGNYPADYALMEPGLWCYRAMHLQDRNGKRHDFVADNVKQQIAVSFLCFKISQVYSGKFLEEKAFWAWILLKEFSQDKVSEKWKVLLAEVIAVLHDVGYDVSEDLKKFSEIWSDFMLELGALQKDHPTVSELL